MINCKNCGGLNSEGSQVCGNCGASLIETQVNNEFSDNKQDISNNLQQSINISDSQTISSEINNQSNSEDINSFDDELIDAYIGNNANKIKNTKFNIWMLLFGALYAWYRKMPKLLAILICTNIVISNISTFLGDVSRTTKMLLYIANMLPSLVAAIEFKQLYLKEVNFKIDKIKKENSGKTQEELVAICIKKGGTTKAPIIFGIIGFILIIAVSIYSSLGLMPNNYKYEGLSISVPKQLVVEDTENPSYWTTTDKLDEKCSLRLDVYPMSDYEYKSIEDYISKAIKYEYTKEQYKNNGLDYFNNWEQYSEIKKLTINDENWTTIDVTDTLSKSVSHNYLIIKNDKLYRINFRNYDNAYSTEEVCSSAYNIIVKSLKFN